MTTPLSKAAPERGLYQTKGKQQMTTRERLAAKLEKREEWAESRRKSAHAGFESIAKPPVNILIEITEKIANDPKMPCMVVDWADETYRKLTDKEQTVRVDDLLALNEIAKDFERGLFMLDHRLASQNK